MSKDIKDELEIAKLAAFTASTLNSVDKSMVQHGSAATGTQPKVDPRKFISQRKPQQGQQPQRRHQIIRNDQFVEQPKSRPLAPEVKGTTSVDVNNLMIPIPDDLKKRAEAAEAPKTAPSQPIQQPTVGRINFENNKPTPSINNADLVNIFERFDKLEKKVNKILRMLRNEKQRQRNMGKKVRKTRTQKTVRSKTTPVQQPKKTKEDFISKPIK